jgi:spore coat polysaccharide biosynthesis protein SpsF
MDIFGQPMLTRVVDRVRRAKSLRNVIVATSTKSSDEPIVLLCKEKSWPCFRGSENDVLDRFFQAAIIYKSDVVVRITSDNPLIDPELADQVIELYLASQPNVDYASNDLPPRTYPLGVDVEVMSFSALKTAWEQDKDPKWREHVTTYILRQPERFRLLSVRSKTNYSKMRWTVDTLEDLEFVRRIYDYFKHDRFRWGDVLVALENHPEWQDINTHIQQKPEPI